MGLIYTINDLKSLLYGCNIAKLKYNLSIWKVNYRSFTTMNYLHYKESPTNEEKMFTKAVEAYGYNEATKLTAAAFRGDAEAEAKIMKYYPYPVEFLHTK